MKKLIVFFLLTLTNILAAKTPLVIEQIIGDNYINLQTYEFFLITGKDTVIKLSSKFILKEKIIFDDSLNLFAENEIKIYYKKNDTDRKEISYNFHLYGDEQKIKIGIYYNRIAMLDLSVTRYFKAPAEIKIISLWDEKIGGAPKYKLINNSTFTFYSLFNEFWGNTYKFENNEWIHKSIGGMCGTRGEGPPFKQNDTIISTGADFIGDNYLVRDKGKYKYVVNMSTGNALSFWKPIPKTYPGKNTHDIYILEKEFEIKTDSIADPLKEKEEIKGLQILIPKK
jgi:hypothetical protein